MQYNKYKSTYYESVTEQAHYLLKNHHGLFSFASQIKVRIMLTSELQSTRCLQKFVLDDKVCKNRQPLFYKTCVWKWFKTISELHAWKRKHQGRWHTMQHIWSFYFFSLKFRDKNRWKNFSIYFTSYSSIINFFKTRLNSFFKKKHFLKIKSVSHCIPCIMHNGSWFVKGRLHW